MTSPPARSHDSFAGRIGVARADITPPVGIYARNWGAAEHDVACAIHRPLFLSVMTLASADGTSPLVLIEADLGWWRPLDVFKRFQSRLLAELKLPASHVLFALTHTHASAPLMEPDPSLPGSELIGPWLDSICDAAVSTTREAIRFATDAVLDWHTGRCGLASVRDLPDPSPENRRFLCGYNPDGLADNTLLVGRVTDAAGQPLATIVNYACHPTTLAWDNTAISPDYIGAMREVMETATGATAFFLQGASGDLAPRYQYVGDTSVADRHGRQLGYAALAVLEDMEPSATRLALQCTVESGAPLAVWAHEPRRPAGPLRAVENAVELDLKDWPTAEELEQQQSACTDRAKQERLRRKLHIRRAVGNGETFAVPVHAWRIGDAALVGCCCEPYSLLQQQLRTRFADRSVACVNLVNGSIGYLPPAELYDVDVYPVWQTPFARGGLERMMEAMQNAVDELWQTG